MPAWTCGQCTFLNHELMERCEMCNASRADHELPHMDVPSLSPTPPDGQPSGEDGQTIRPETRHIPEDILTGGPMAVDYLPVDVMSPQSTVTFPDDRSPTSRLPEPMAPMSKNNSCNRDSEESPMSEPKHVEAAMCLSSIERDRAEKDLDYGWSFLDKELRIVLIGKTGVGKSTTGNNILNQDLFKSSACGTSITRKCQIGFGIRFDRDIQVIDTPGMFDTGLTTEEITQEVVKCVGMSSPGPHAFILVIRLDRFTAEEKSTVEHFIKIFGKEMLKYLIILFTRKDDLKYEGKTVDEYVQSVPQDLQELVKACQNRYLAIDNRGTAEEKEQDVRDLVEMVDSMVRANGGGHYTNEMYEEAEIIIAAQEEEHSKNLQEKMKLEMQRLREEVEEELKRKDEERERNLDSMRGVMTELGMTENGDDWVHITDKASLEHITKAKDEQSLRQSSSPGGTSPIVGDMNVKSLLSIDDTSKKVVNNPAEIPNSFGVASSLGDALTNPVQDGSFMAGSVQGRLTEATAAHVGGCVEAVPTGGLTGGFVEAASGPASAPAGGFAAVGDAAGLMESTRLIEEARILRLSLERIERDKKSMRAEYIVQQEAALDKWRKEQMERRREVRHEMEDEHSGIFAKMFGAVKRFWQRVGQFLIHMSV